MPSTSDSGFLPVRFAISGQLRIMLVTKSSVSHQTRSPIHQFLCPGPRLELADPLELDEACCPTHKMPPHARDLLLLVSCLE